MQSADKVESKEPKVLPPPRRKRSATVMNLQWHGERVNRAIRIKELIEAGEYKVSSKELARTMLEMV